MMVPPANSDWRQEKMQKALASAPREWTGRRKDGCGKIIIKRNLDDELFEESKEPGLLRVV